jgi:hypothetical protein
MKDMVGDIERGVYNLAECKMVFYSNFTDFRPKLRMQDGVLFKLG